MKYKAVVFGCQQIAVDCIKILLAKGVELARIVTYELPLDKVYGYKSVKDIAHRYHIQCDMSPRLSADYVDEIARIKPDIIFSFYYRKIFPKKLLSIAPLGVVNIHPSFLPYYRGRVPTAWAILNGEKEIGVTIHYVDEHIDSGDIIVQKKVKIPNHFTGFELYNKCMQVGKKLFGEIVDQLLAGKAPRKPQLGRGSYYGSLTSQQMRIDWSLSVDKIINQIRVFCKPYSGVEARILNKIVVIWKASSGDSKQYLLQGPGKILDILPGDKLLVSCVDGVIVFEDYDFFPPLNETEKPIYLKKGIKFD